jgi:hypothetical protein
MSGTTLENWGNTAASRPRTIEAPANLPQLIGIVTQAAADGRRVRAMGHRHSVNHCFEADGEVQVDMSAFEKGKAPVVDAAAATITVPASATLLDVRDALAGHGLELPVAPEIGNATAGAVACSGTKDGSLDGRAPGTGQIASLVEQVAIVGADGATHTLRGAALHTFRSSHGLMGIVHQVTFRAVPREVLALEYEWLALRPLPSIDRIFQRHGGGRAHGVLAFIQAFEGKLLVERRTRLDDVSPPPPRDRLKRVIRDFIWEWGQNGVLKQIESLRPTLGRLLDLLPVVQPGAEPPPAVVQALRTALDTALDAIAVTVPENQWNSAHAGAMIDRVLTALLPAAALGNPVVAAKHLLRPPAPRDEADFLLALADRTPLLLEVLGGYRAHRSDSMIDFAPDRWPLVFDFTFWAFPRSRWETLVPEYVAFCKQFHADTGYRPSIFAEIYFIDRDQHSLLSFSPDEPIFTLNLVDAPREIGGTPAWDPRWAEMNARFNEWAVDADAQGRPRGGRPILNQTKELQATPQVLSRAFGAKWAQFVAAAGAADPKGRFVTDFFAKLGIPRPAL